MDILQRHSFNEFSPTWVIETSVPNKNIPSFELIKNKVEVSQTKAKSRYDELKKVREADFKIGERVRIRRPYKVRGSKYYQETKVVQVTKHSVKVEWGKCWIKRKVAKLGKEAEAQGFQLKCKDSGDVTVGLRSENSFLERITFSDGGCAMSGGVSGVVDGEAGERDDITVIEQEEIQNHAQGETAKVVENQHDEQERFPDKLQKSKRVINKPKY
ncbi:hypothetical protein NDU88_002316 [Pleurodeles waltl]|uniref:Uncharacterized protein n=1 Tax=Pleurodeles waltl TaxID=8319 RepID=A0AAV7SCC8_PLEWA|nr:hypothetical protein NDU88_002316 [Pleurodeles waltl]